MVPPKYPDHSAILGLAHFCLPLLTVLSTLSSCCKTSVEWWLENLALQQQLAVLRRSASKRLPLSPRRIESSGYSVWTLESRNGSAEEVRAAYLRPRFRRAPASQCPRLLKYRVNQNLINTRLQNCARYMIFVAEVNERGWSERVPGREALRFKAVSSRLPPYYDRLPVARSVSDLGIGKLRYRWSAKLNRAAAGMQACHDAY